jgi:hypothetical protein
MNATVNKYLRMEIISDSPLNQLYVMNIPIL